jgi:hypothetical protein
LNNSSITHLIILIISTHDSLKSDTKSITILDAENVKHSVPAHGYGHARYAAKATTAAPEPIAITSDHPSRQPIEAYEFEEQIVYELQPHIANKSTAISDEYSNPPQEQQHSLHHDDDVDDDDVREELTAIVSTSENVKPHLNLPPVPNDLTKIYGSKHPNVEANEAEGDYYDKDIDNDYDEVIRDGSPTPNAGRPGIDFPNFHEIPPTAFSCKEQRYKGFFGDPETRCQVWHYCDLNGGKASFLCPNGTIFSQTALTCDW